MFPLQPVPPRTPAPPHPEPDLPTAHTTFSCPSGREVRIEVLTSRSLEDGAKMGLRLATWAGDVVAEVTSLGGKAHARCRERGLSWGQDITLCKECCCRVLGAVAGVAAAVPVATVAAYRMLCGRAGTGSRTVLFTACCSRLRLRPR